ncbi:hypothetical protein ACMGE6_10760 [Macrococcus equi]|uniref:hypothetical protein n=1 Tax=Macrococcus equi TaxID=3395462 RepID=UPI0039BDF1DB
MSEEILINFIEDFLKGKLSVVLFAKYYRDIFGFLLNEEEVSPYRYKYLKELHEYLENYDYYSAGTDDYYYLTDDDVKKETSKIYSLLNN